MKIYFRRKEILKPLCKLNFSKVAIKIIRLICLVPSLAEIEYVQYMSQNGKTRFKILQIVCKIFKEYLTILGHCALKG